MQGIGHFPFAENPKRFAEYLLPILAELKKLICLRRRSFRQACGR
jgi:hypothetical protein